MVRKAHDIEPSFEEIAKLVPADLMKCSGEVFYSGRAAFTRPSLVYPVGDKPGFGTQFRQPQQAEAENSGREHRVRENKAGVLLTVLRQVGGSRARLMQKGVQHLFENTDLVADATPASNCIFVRTRRANKLRNRRGLEELCWPFHKAVIERLGV